MIASYRILFFAFLLLGTHACKLRTPGSSLFDDMPQGVRIESDPIQHNLEEIVRVGESNNFSYTHADLNAALTGGGDISKATSLLKSKYIYQQIEGVERMVGYMFYQIVDGKYIIMTDMAIDQSIPEANHKAIEGVVRTQLYEVYERTKLPILHTIFNAHSKKVELIKNTGFQAITQVLNRPVGSGVSEIGDIVYQDEYFKLGDVSQEIIDEFANNYERVSLLNRFKIKSVDPVLRDQALRGLVDLREYYRKFPTKHTEPVANRIIEENVLKTLFKTEVASYILLGEKGGGKSYNLDLIMAKLARGGYPEISARFGNNFEVLLMNPNNIKAGTSYRGQLENRLKGIGGLSSSRPLIIYVDEVHRLAGMGKDDAGGSDFFESFKEHLADGRIRIIGATTPQEYYDTLFGRDAVIDRFNIDYFDFLPREDVHAIINHHLKKKGIPASPEVVAKIFELAERFAPNGGQVRAKVMFIDEIFASRGIKRTTGPLTLGQTLQYAREYWGLKNLVLPEESAQFVKSRSIDPAIAKAVLAGLVENSSAQIAILEGPDGSGRSYMSETIARELGRPQIEINMLQYLTPETFPELMQVILKEVSMKGSSYKIIAFKNTEAASPIVQNLLIDMFKKGVITTKVRDANTGQLNTKKIRVPNVMAHFLFSPQAVPQLIASAAPHRVVLNAREADAYKSIVRANLDRLLASDEFKHLNLSEQQKSAFIDSFSSSNFKAGVSFDTDAAKLAVDLRALSIADALGGDVPAWVRDACNNLHAKAPKGK